MNNPVLVLNIPDEKNVYFVGDIHGQYDLYKRTLKTFGITDDDVVISVGDLIDRGPKTAATLFEFLFDENRYAIMGNHEYMCIAGAHDRSWYNVWFNNGGQEFTREVGLTGVNFFRDYLAQLPFVIEVHHRGKVLGVSHAAVPLRYTDWDTFKTDVQNGSNDILDGIHWSTDTFKYCQKNNVLMAPRISGVDYVFSGHTSVTNPLIYGNRVWIDSMYLSGELTVAYLDGNMLRHKRLPRDEHSFKRGSSK